MATRRDQICCWRHPTRTSIIVEFRLFTNSAGGYTHHASSALTRLFLHATCAHRAQRSPFSLFPSAILPCNPQDQYWLRRERVLLSDAPLPLAVLLLLPLLTQKKSWLLCWPLRNDSALSQRFISSLLPACVSQKAPRKTPRHPRASTNATWISAGFQLGRGGMRLTTHIFLVLAIVARTTRRRAGSGRLSSRPRRRASKGAAVPFRAGRPSCCAHAAWGQTPLRGQARLRRRTGPANDIFDDV